MQKKKEENPKQNNLKHRRFYVEGMHCASCEVLIEKSILEIDGVQAVDASLRNNSIDIRHDENRNVTIKAINKELQQYGYTVGHKKVQTKKKRNIAKIIAVVLGIILVFFIVEKLQFGQYVSVDSSSSLPALFLFGIVAGLSSCAALIGGLLLSMTKQWNELYINSSSKKEKSRPHIMFHIGRIGAFFVFGGILGLIGETISLDNPVVFSILTILISLIMLILALQMLEVRWAQKLKFSAPSFITRYAANEKNFKGKYMPFLTGALTFFLPCGFTLIAQTIALTSGSFIQGSLIMALFALGTFPILLGISASSIGINTKPHRTAMFNKVAGAIILFFVLYNINGQLNVLDLPSLSDIFSKQENVVVQSDSEQDLETTEQTITLIADGFEYTPEGSMTLKAGVPATLIVDNQGIRGCGAFLASRGLIKNYVALEPGKNEIDIGTPKKGKYKVTCSMGMVAPVVITVQ